MNFVNKTILEIPENHSLLEYAHELQELLRETDLVHRLFFWKSPWTPNLQESYQLPDDTQNLDFMYRVSCALYHDGDTSHLLRHLLQDSVRHLSKTIYQMLFINPSPDQLQANLKVNYKKDKVDGSFIFQNCPKILKKTMPPLFLAV